MKRVRIWCECKPYWDHEYESELVGMSLIVSMIVCVGMRAESKLI